MIARARIARLCTAAALALCAAGAQAKPVYLTVPRSFGTGEAPTIEVAFERRGPVELRIVKPVSVERFVARQANLRRAYEQPSTTENPGRHLSRGLNAVRAPGTFLYRALGEDFRRALARALPKRPAQSGASDRPLARLAEGPERLVSLPPDSTLVHRTWLNLDLGGPERDYSVPGFDAFAPTGGWEERKILLDPLPAGVYLVQLVQGRVEAQVVLVVTDLKVQVKQTDGDVLVRVAGKDLRPVAGAEVRLRAANGPAGSGRTGANGEVHLASSEPRLLVLVSSGGDTAVADTDFYSTLAASPDVFVFTDRPIYRPGDTVRFRGLARQPDAFLARLFAPKEREVTVALAVGEEREVTAHATVDEFGSFHGQLAIPGDADAGVVRLTARLDGQPHSAEARVQEYVKPTFYVEVLGESEAIRPGEKLKARIRARRYAGGAPPGTRYEVFLYRALLDAPAWVDDAGLGAQGSAVTYGSVSTTEGKLSVPARLFSSIDAREQQYAEDPWATAPTLDANGEAEVEIAVPALESGDERFPWRYSVSIRARDDQGTFANGARSYFLAPSEVLGTVQVGAAVALSGGKAPLSIRATTLSGAPFGGAAGSVELVLRRADGGEKQVSKQAFTTGPDGVWRGTVPAPEAGTVVARVTLEDRRGRPWSGEASLLVVGTKGEESVRVPVLQLASRGVPLAPGENAEMVALFPSGWGPGGKSAGKVWLTLSGTGIFQTRILDVRGLSLVHRFEVERRFGSAVYASIAYPTPAGRWVEKTASFRIVPPERVLAIAISPERPEAEPLGPQTLAMRVTDHLGRGVKAQVSVGVVDKAIYALQGELRPRVLDFFYPPVRNNVATFSSAEFQGYGYGELLARALGRQGVAFAAVKPPTRTREVDTAYWNPAVTTDADGRAQVTFSLPSNQTLWSVTAVAADASGRFGEGTAEFAARGGTALVASMPLFLREGDRAQGSIRIARSEKGGAAKLDLDVALEGPLARARVKEAIALSPRGERIVPVPLEASEPGTGRVVVLASSRGDRPIADRRDVPIRPASVEEIVTAASFGGGRLALAIPAGAKVEDVSLALRPSSVALALAQVEDLLTYPHGCLEQLVATTIPNVALYRVLEKTGAVDALDAPARGLLAEARSRSALGIEQILALARSGGGFTWFSGEDDVSVPLTLIALDGLVHAADAGLVSRTDSRLVESAEWLGSRDDLPLSLEATRAYVLARLEGTRQAARVRALLDRVAEGPSASDPYPVAMAALAADRAGIGGEPPVKARIDALAARASEALVRTADLRVGQGYFDFPLRRAGLTAILGHAASLRSVDVAVARRRLAEALSDRAALSTFERSTAILHSLWLIERDAKAMKTGAHPAVEVEGGAGARLSPRGAGLAASLGREVRAVTVAPFDGQAELRARIRIPLASARPVAQGMSIERTYWRLLPGGSRKPLRAGDSLAQGEEVFVELSLDAHEGDEWRTLRSAYYVVEDHVPAGFSPLGEDKAYRGAPYGLPIAAEAMKRRSLSPERALFYFEEPAWWSRSPRRIGYVLRASFPGRFSAPPATIEDMYAPRVHGRSAPAVLEVKPSAASR
jgi:hypothetical protein